MAEHDLRSVAFPNLDESRLAALDRCPLTKLAQYRDGEKLFPRCDWIPPEIERDDMGFVRTGLSVAQSPHWTAKRQPFLLETSRPGVFAAGDVRAGSIKRVASAVGEGAMTVQFVHEYLKAM